MNNEIITAAKELLEKSPFIQSLNVELLDLTDSFAKGRMPFNKNYENPYGTMHGGCLYALADTIGGTLANASGKMVTTVDGNLKFLEPAYKTEYIYCEATLIRSGKHLITINVDIKDDSDKLLDCGYFTFYKTNMDLIPSKI